jgi:hypothetical protein
MNSEPSDDVRTIEAYNTIRNTYIANGSSDENFIKLITAQAMHESAVFDSVLYHNNNNAFGMRQAHVRETTSLGEKGSYASYDNLASSALDVLLWIRYNKLPEIYPGLDIVNVRAFTKALKDKGYYEDSYLNYTNAVGAHLKHLLPLISQG